jgi:rhodanese-related sulfurtransferase
VSLVALSAAEAAAGGGRFDAVIDVRSPAEFAEDHLPGALNWPVLDDEQRRIVGTLYKHESPLKARKVGAAMVARNIADHLDRWIADKPREWRPLVYCWRGGQRSGSLAWFLGQIGFRTAQLQGGYKAFRTLVRTDLQALPQRYCYRVLCGRTGSGKPGFCMHWPRRVRRHWTWKAWPGTAVRCWAPCRVARSPARSASTPWSGRHSGASTRNDPCSWKARAARSAGCAYPRR